MLQERLLRILDRKSHWAWLWFAEGRVPLPRLLPHFQQEWGVYVRDFPQLLARIMGHAETPQDARAMLAANIYEEQTGGISGTTSHPELFLRMMEGCGFRRSDFEQIQLFPGAKRYRKFLELRRVHKKVEGGHRLDAWKMVLDHTPAGLEVRVVRAVERALERWLAYRDDVARACGIPRVATEAAGGRRTRRAR